jgi:hypothetical protein
LQLLKKRINGTGTNSSGAFTGFRKLQLCWTPFGSFMKEGTGSVKNKLVCGEGLINLITGGPRIAGGDGTR